MISHKFKELKIENESDMNKIIEHLISLNFPNINDEFLCFYQYSVSLF